MRPLTTGEIRQLFELLNAELGKTGVKGELFLVSSAVMFLAYNARGSTHVIDAFFRPAKQVREAALKVAAQAGVRVQIGSTMPSRVS